MSYQAGLGATEAIKVSTDNVSHRVARERIETQHRDIHNHEQRAESDAEVSVPNERFERVIPEEEEEEEGWHHEETVSVLQNEWELRFSCVIALELTDSAARRIHEECSVVGFAVVV